MKTSEWTGRVGYVLMLSCTVLVTASVVRHEFFPPKGRLDARSLDTRALAVGRVVKNWQAMVSVGHRMGADGAPLTLVEFSNFECPFCRTHEINLLSPLVRRLPGQVAVVHGHWALPGHRFAYPAARASECAAAQGKFTQFYGLLYAQQDSLGLKPFERFAKESGVSDSTAFNRCNSSTAPVPAIDRDGAAIVAAGGHGTPSVAINGWLFPAPPDSAALDSAGHASLKKRGRS
jgi:protein-disulfide isomerase